MNSTLKGYGRNRTRTRTRTGTVRSQPGGRIAGVELQNRCRRFEFEFDLELELVPPPGV